MPQTLYIYYRGCGIFVRNIYKGEKILMNILEASKGKEKDKIRTAIKSVQESGICNMLDVNTVSQFLYIQGEEWLGEIIDNDHRAYGTYIMTVF